MTSSTSTPAALSRQVSARLTSTIRGRFGAAASAPAPRDGSLGRSTRSVAAVAATRAAMDLSGADLVDRDLSGANLSGADLSGADLRGATLIGANLADATLKGARLDGADVTGAVLTGVDATRVSAQGTDFAGADLSGSRWFLADLARARLDDAVVDGADFRKAGLLGASMRSARIHGAEFTNVDARRVDFTSADVADSVFRDACFDSATFRGLRGYRHADWVGIRADNADFSGAHLPRREMIDQNELAEFRAQGAGHEALYWLWWGTSDCGRSLLRWIASAELMILAFAVLLAAVGVDIGEGRSVIDALYVSVTTFCSVGLATDVVGAGAGLKLVLMLEALTGLAMMAGFVAIMVNKTTRR
ncbi:MAG: pentapeptide repeat-containing protein [Acidimicrobiales bacterium]